MTPEERERASRRNPRKASQRDSDVTKSCFPVTTSGVLKRSLTDWEALPEAEVNQEMKMLCLGLTYLKTAKLHLAAAQRAAKNPNVEYADKLRATIGLMETAVKEWPLTVR